VGPFYPGGLPPGTFWLKVLMDNGLGLDLWRSMLCVPGWACGLKAKGLRAACAGAALDLSLYPV
jgi:hypothetical protein